VSGRHHPGAQEASEIADCFEPGRSAPVLELRREHQASHDPDDLLCTGIVHHIAWRTPDDASQLAARSELVSAGFNVSPVMDRNYFHSIYYREPGGVLFEIATDPPGFSVDESPEDLGSKLMLPPWLEGHRSFLEATLPPLTPSRATVRQSPDKRGSEADV
jgi:glyoxalase family protein